MTDAVQYADEGALDVSPLRAGFAGEVVVPGDAGWDEARQAWNLAVDQRPAAVALPATADDIAAVVRFASANGLRVAPQATGHNAAPLGPLDDAILLKTSRMRAVTIDPEAQVARVEAGAQWMDVVPRAAEHGLAALAGSAPDVGVAGYTLGGGVSWLARRYGLAANSVTAIEIVTADGRLRRVDHKHEPDLFWALRGGGGSFGAVTALEFKLYPLTEVYAGVLFFPLERSREVLNAWRAWVDEVPEEVTSIGRMLRFPPIPDLPEFLRGRSFVVVEAAMVGDVDGEELLRPLRELGPEIDTFATIPMTGLAELHMDPPQPVPGKGDGILLSDVTEEAIDAILEVAGPGVESPFLSVEIRHIGGALARRQPHHGALNAFDARFAMFSVGVVMGPAMARAIEADLVRMDAAVARWDAGSSYVNFRERPLDAGRFYRDDAYHRLQAVKAVYDPGNVFRANHEIALAEPAAAAGPQRSWRERLVPRTPNVAPRPA